MPSTHNANVVLFVVCVQIFFYSGTIFETAKIPAAYVPFAVIGTNAVNVIMTLIAVIIYAYI